jgi:ketosteroid isomerase-like protein
MADVSTAAAEGEALRAVMDGVTRGFHHRDAEAIGRFYAEDAVLADLAPPLLHRGEGGGLQEWLDGWDGPVELSYRDMAWRTSGDLAVGYGLLHTRTTRDGEAAAWWARLTVVLARTGAGWRIVHEHTSVPFYMDGSARAAVDLEP